MSFKSRNTRKFKSSPKTTIKTSAINNTSTKRNVVTQPVQGPSKPQKNYQLVPEASAVTSSPTVTWDMSGNNTVYNTSKGYDSIYDKTDDVKVDDDTKHNLLTPQSNAIESRNVVLEDKKKSYVEHTVKFKNLYGNNEIKTVKVKTRGSHLNNDATVRRLAVMELQKQDPKKHHGNLFSHVYNTDTNTYVGFKNPTVSNSKNLTDSNKNPRLVPVDPPRLYGDRELPGIGRISYTGFAGGKNKKGDPFKFTKPDKLKKVWNTYGTPQWMEAKKLKPSAIEKKLINQFQERKLSRLSEDGRHRTSGGQNVFGSLDQYQSQKSYDWSIGGKDFKSPGWKKSEEVIKERRRISNLKKNKPPKGASLLEISEWEFETGLKY